MSFDEFSKHGFTTLSMFEFSKRFKKTIISMSFDEIRQHGFTMLSMFQFSKRVEETMFIMSLDEFNKRGFAILSNEILHVVIYHYVRMFRVIFMFGVIFGRFFD